MITCHEAVGQLWEYLDHSVDEVDRARVEEHLARCRRCCAEVEFAKEMRRVLAEGAEVDVPRDVLARLHRTLEEMDQ
jgi:anti-sigma factor (TIGR02949 family)